MTPQEATLLKQQQPGLQFFDHLDRRFVYLQGQPCPLLAWDRGKAVCTVYTIRPYNCRRFGCFRPDPATEPYERERVDLAHARLGCANLSDRLIHRKVRKAYALLQRKAQRWALQHGWDPAMTGPPIGSDVKIFHLTPVP